MTHITNAADEQHGNAGCLEQCWHGQCPSPCVNWKWLDFADTVIRRFDALMGNDWSGNSV